MEVPKDLSDRCEQYLRLSADGAKIKALLGYGTDGAVWSSTRGSAIKVFERDRGYYNERDSYLRLAEYGFTDQIAGFAVPAMIHFDNDLMVVEMDIMQSPPFIIDFAKVRIDRPPEFSEETLADSEDQGLSLFGEKWPLVKHLMDVLESIQIYYLDPKPHNIVFPRD